MFIDHGIQFSCEARFRSMSISLVLLFIALVLFGLSALGVNAPRVNLQSAGLFFWVLSLLVH